MYVYGIACLVLFLGQLNSQQTHARRTNNCNWVGDSKRLTIITNLYRDKTPRIMQQYDIVLRSVCGLWFFTSKGCAILYTASI